MFGSLHPCERQGGSSRYLVLAQPSSDHCGHLRSQPGDGRPLSTTLPFKYTCLWKTLVIKKKTQWKDTPAFHIKLFKSTCCENLPLDLRLQRTCCIVLGKCMWMFSWAIRNFSKRSVATNRTGNGTIRSQQNGAKRKLISFFSDPTLVSSNKRGFNVFNQSGAFVPLVSCSCVVCSVGLEKHIYGGCCYLTEKFLCPLNLSAWLFHVYVSNL